jgi:hypothetical protein
MLRARLVTGALGAAAVGVAVAAAVGFGAGPAHADAFDMCPDGHEGVVGGHTTCAFAENVRQVFYAQGLPSEFVAFSPVTGYRYDMDCGGIIPAHFVDGQTLRAIRCYGGENAEVVIW